MIYSKMTGITGEHYVVFFQIYRTDLSDLTTSWKSDSFQVGTGLMYSQHETTM